MYYQAIVKTPSNLAVLDVDGAGDYIIGNAIVGELAAMWAEWPEHPCSDGGTIMPGTRVVVGEKLNHVILNIDSEDPLTLLEGVIAGHGLDWEVLALEYFYISDKYTTDLETGETVELPADRMDGPAIEPFLQDVVVDGTPEAPIMGRPTLPAPLHAIDGNVQMVVPVS